MAELNVDVAILGAGTAGLVARRTAWANGAQSVVMVAPPPYGTTCARVGCMPSKLLIAAAEAAHHARTASKLGVDAQVQVDGVAVMERVRRERDRFVGFVTPTTDELGPDELIRDYAKVTGPNTLEAGGRTVRFNALVVATGTTPFVPPPFRDLENLTNEEIFELERPPESLLVIGLGVIGLELGQAFSRLGSRVTILGVGGKVGPVRDPVVRESALQAFREELDLHPSYQLKRVEPHGQGARIHFVDSLGNERHETYDRVLMAAGRRTTLPALGLEGDIDPATLQLGDAPIFVAGDANQLHPLLHEAADDGRIAGQNAARWPDVQPAERRVPLGILFTEPQLAIVGDGWESLPDDVRIGQVDFGDQGRSRTMGQNKGISRVYADRDGRLLGGELFGPRAEHLAHLLAWAVQSGMTAEQALAMPFYHPVIEEGLRTALRGLLD